MSSRKKPKYNPNEHKITISWDGDQKEPKFNIEFKPDLLHKDTILRNHTVLLANAFDAGIKTIVSVLREIEQPTEEELKNFEYDFSKHDKDTFALYNYKKAIMEEIATIVQNTLTDAFHDVLYVKGVQEKIFQQLRDKKKLEKESEETEETTTKGGIN